MAPALAARCDLPAAGGLPPLVSLLDDGNTAQAHEHAVAALTRLSRDNPDNQTQIAKKLVAILSLPSEGAQKRSAQVLWDLAGKNLGAPVRIVNAGAISPLVALLGKGTSEEAREEAVGALACLAHGDASNQLAIATGLVALLGSGSAEAQEHVTLLLLSLASDADNREAIAKAGAVHRLVNQLAGGGSTRSAGAPWGAGANGKLRKAGHEYHELN